jgi:hypothetical protein
MPELNNANVLAYGISIESLLGGRTDISGIFITYISSPNVKVVTISEEGAVSRFDIGDDTTPVDETNSKYYDKTIDGNNAYILILDNSEEFIEDTLMDAENIRYKLPLPTEYPLDTGASYEPSSGDTYEIPLDSNDPTPIIYQETVTIEDINSIPPPLGDYALQRVLKAFNNDAVTTPYINNFKVYETITEDIKAQIRTLEDGTTIRPQFKSYNDYLAYKNSLNNRKYVQRNS